MGRGQERLGEAATVLRDVGEPLDPQTQPGPVVITLLMGWLGIYCW